MQVPYLGGPGRAAAMTEAYLSAHVVLNYSAECSAKPVPCRRCLPALYSAGIFAVRRHRYGLACFPSH